jgi:glycosyltransferase involved in cell wall biosynthesis
LQRTYSIITTCKGRLDQLKVSLPRMVEQDGAEVIVVDYDCPERTGEFVEREFPTVKVVRLHGEPFFSNWRARNRGAEVATSDMLVFCDADTVLAADAIRKIDESVPAGKYGFFGGEALKRFIGSGPRLQQNQFRGFQVVPTAAFRKLGGYDDVLEGYAAGGDTDLEERLQFVRVPGHQMDPAIVDRFLEHDNRARLANHKDPLKVSYPAGMLYRQAKMSLMSLNRKANLPLPLRQQLYRQAVASARNLEQGQDRCRMIVFFKNQPVGMPRQLGFEKGSCRTAIQIEITLEQPLDQIPE